MAAADLTTKVSTKGQVILPKVIRESLHWDHGTQLSGEQTADDVLLRPLSTVFPPSRPEDVFGCLPYEGKPQPVGATTEGIIQEVKRRHAGGRY